MKRTSDRITCVFRMSLSSKEVTFMITRVEKCYNLTRVIELEKELKYVFSFIEEVKGDMLRGKYNYNTELYLQLLRCERYLSKELKELQESKVKNE